MSVRSSDESRVYRLSRRAHSNRIDPVLSIARGRNVLHVGALDSPVTDRAICSGKWLHSRLREVSDSLLGVDIDEEAYQVAQNHGEASDIVLWDLTRGLPSEASDSLDLVVMAEVIEHLPDPGNMLRQLAAAVTPGTQLVLTTVNALSLRRSLYALVSRERVHPDHVMYFSQSTLERLFSESGWTVESASHYRGQGGRTLRLFDRLVAIIAPGALSGVVLIGRSS